jgi:hypothetical protein
LSSAAATTTSEQTTNFKRTLAWARHLNKAHYCADGPKDNKEIEECQNTKCQTGIVGDNPKSDREKLEMKQEQTDGCKRKPSCRWTKGACAREAEHGRYQPRYSAKQEQSQKDGDKIGWLIKSPLYLRER